MKNHLLIIDDEENLSFFLKQSLDKEGYTATIANTIAEADEIINRQFPDLLLLDLNLSDGNGLDLYRELRKKEIIIPTIVITAHGSVQSAIDALKMGVDDYIAKPFDLNELLVIVENLLERFHLFNQLKYYRQKAKDNYDKQFFVSQLLQIKEIQYLALKIAEVPTSTVLIEGTTGTGKEMFARYIHNNSLQVEAPFVEINCASIPDNLLESELFGYEPGAFTDAKKRKIGLIELAKGGTLFLDEIAEMSTSIQAKLLRFIETLSFKRLGGVNDIKVEVRIIAATNKDIEDYVSKGKFREDLFFRLNMFRLKLPKLCERKEEILLLAQFFLEQISARLKKKIKYIAPESK
ncbi:MAG: sigma-54-dependent Fis family transcriptional regulator, partial [Calditrichia bacterium]|nr:sigma-54-dependent Fis family transcriptional regulator [Calditrichia bacterium]